MSASETLQRLQSQADPSGRYSGRRHVFGSGEPSLLQHKYIRSQLFGARANVDMVHFLVVGPRGELVGNVLEFVQQWENPSSAMDPQDFFSNWLGSQFFNGSGSCSYRPSSRTPLSVQLREFFDAYNAGDIRPELPPGGMPELPANIRTRLTSHDSEAEPLSNFVTFVRDLERWLAAGERMEKQRKRA